MRLFNLILFALIFIPAIAKTQAPEIHCKHFFKGYPLGAPKSNDLIIRDLYALSSNDSTKFADWVAYYLTMHEVDGSLDLEREWRNDPYLDTSETLEGKPERQDDYKGVGNVGYDRGHLAPLGNFSGSRFASQVNYYSNIVPQSSPLNQGPWKILEDKERSLVKTGKSIYVMTGTLYERDMPPLPNADEPHVVPSGFWKIIIYPESENQFQVVAFIMDQDTDRRSSVLDHLVTIDEIERRSRLDFFWQLPISVQNTFESNLNQNWAEQWFR